MSSSVTSRIISQLCASAVALRALVCVEYCNCSALYAHSRHAPVVIMLTWGKWVMRGCALELRTVLIKVTTTAGARPRDCAHMTSCHGIRNMTFFYCATIKALLPQLCCSPSSHFCPDQTDTQPDTVFMSIKSGHVSSRVKENGDGDK